MTIPDLYKKVFCFGKDAHLISHCDFYIHTDCPNSCGYAKMFQEDSGLCQTNQTGLCKRVELEINRRLKER